MKILIFLTILSFALPGFSRGIAIKEKMVEYKDGDVTLEGFLAYPVRGGKKKPGVVLVHEWMGLNDYAKDRARQVAGLGYIVFAADIYGKGVRAKSFEEAGKLAGKYKGDRPLLRERVKAAYEELLKQPGVDPSKTAVMGYCFGGTTALELARSGAPVLGTVSFHGGLSSPTPEGAKNIKGKVLVLAGGDDPTMGRTEVDDFKKEMKDAHVDMKFVSYPGAVHGFTNPANGPLKPGAAVAYDRRADLESWDQMKNFYKEIFGK